MSSRKISRKASWSGRGAWLGAAGDGAAAAAAATAPAAAIATRLPANAVIAAAHVCPIPGRFSPHLKPIVRSKLRDLVGQVVDEQHSIPHGGAAARPFVTARRACGRGPLAAVVHDCSAPHQESLNGRIFCK